MSTASTIESALAARRRLLGAITLVLLVGEVVSAFFITFVAGAVIFACLFGVGALLVRRGGVAGPLLVAVLCAFEVTDFPFWQRHSTAAVIGQSIFAAVALAGLLVAIAVTWRSLAGRRSGAVAARI
jgi:hypothetical protein